MKRTIHWLGQGLSPPHPEPTPRYPRSGLGYYTSSLTLGWGQGLRQSEPLAVYQDRILQFRLTCVTSA